MLKQEVHHYRDNVKSCLYLSNNAKSKKGFLQEARGLEAKRDKCRVIHSNALFIISDPIGPCQGIRARDQRSSEQISRDEFLYF